jgi:hypothetical protein
MDEIDNIVRKWRGLLGWETYIDETVDEQVLAFKMELAARYILVKREILKLSLDRFQSEESSTPEKMIETCIFPIIFRVINNGGVIEDIPTFYNHLLNFFNTNRGIMFEYIGYPNIDIEAELCSLFAESYVRGDYNKPIVPIKHVKRWMK